MNTLQIRPAKQIDVPVLCDLYLEFHEFHAAAVPDRLQSLRQPGRLDKEELARKIATLLHEDHASLQVAEMDGQIIGLAELYLREEDNENSAMVVRRYAHLQSLMVTTAARRNGIGRALLKAAEAWAAENGAEEVRLEVWEFTDGPLRFYETAGYRTLKRTLIRQLGDERCDAS